ncbi:unnamed protein product [Amoebophrya sp. A120]|nr:unnamed protein product [Amoebophrya sp. A120]|eukprot:GSA120T00002382001.1
MSGSFTLPPNVRGTSRGYVRIDVTQADGPVYLLWWGETREMKLLPNEPLEIPINTSPERFGYYLADDPSVDVRIGDEVGSIDLQPFVQTAGSHTTLDVGGRFRIGSSDIDISIVTCWKEPVTTTEGGPKARPSGSSYAAAESSGSASNAWSNAMQTLPTSPRFSSADIDDVNGSAARQWAALAERAEKLREDMTESLAENVSRGGLKPQAHLETIMAADPFHNGDTETIPVAASLRASVEQRPPKAHPQEQTEQGVHAFNMFVKPEPTVSATKAAPAEGPSTSAPLEVVPTGAAPAAASQQAIAAPTALAKGIVSLQWVTFRGMNVKRASLVLQAKQSANLVSCHSQRAQVMHIQKETKKEMVTKVYFNADAAKRDFTRGVLPANSPALITPSGSGSAKQSVAAELAMEIQLPASATTGGSALLSPYLDARSLMVSEAVRASHITAYSSVSEYSALKLVSEAYSAEVPVNEEALTKEEYTVPIHSSEGARKIIGKACFKVKVVPMKQCLRLQIGSFASANEGASTVPPTSNILVSYKLPTSASSGTSTPGGTSRFQEMESPWMPANSFRYSSQHFFDLPLGGPNKLFVQVWSERRSTTEFAARSLLGICKVQVPWPDGSMSCRASVQPVSVDQDSSGAPANPSTLEVSLQCATGYADSFADDAGSSSTGLGSLPLRTASEAGVQQRPAEPTTTKETFVAVVSEAEDVRQGTASFPMSSLGPPGGIAGGSLQYGGSSGSDYYRSAPLFPTALRKVVAAGLATDDVEPPVGMTEMSIAELERHLALQAVLTKQEANAVTAQVWGESEGRVMLGFDAVQERERAMVSCSFVREWLRQRVAPVREALSRIGALAQDETSFLFEINKLLGEQTTPGTAAASLSCDRLVKTLTRFFPPEEGTLKVCVRQIFDILLAPENTELEVRFLVEVFQRYLERKQESEFKAKRCLVALSNALEGRNVKDLFRAYSFQVDALVASLSGASAASGSKPRRSTTTPDHVGVVTQSQVERALRTPPQSSRLLQGTASSRNKSQSPRKAATGIVEGNQPSSPAKAAVPFAQSAYAGMVVGAAPPLDENSMRPPEQEDDATSPGQHLAQIQQATMERRRITVVHRKAFEHVLTAEVLTAADWEDPAQCLADYLEVVSHKRHVDLDRLQREMDRATTAPDSSSDPMLVEDAEGDVAVAPKAAPEILVASEDVTALAEPVDMPKLPSHPAAVNIIKELLSLLISGCTKTADAVAMLDNAAALIARNPNRDDVAIAVAAWKELGLNSSGLASVLALQAFCSWSKAQRRMEVTEENISKMQKVFFYFYDFENNSLFLKLFEVILASHVDPIKAFRILDADQDGKLTIDDFILMLKKLGLPLSDSDKECYQRYGGDKTFTLQEFLESFNRFRSRRFGYVDEVAQSAPPPKTSVDLSHVGDASRRELFLRTNQYCFNLPAYFTFALLENRANDGNANATPTVSRSLFLKFVYQVLGGGIMTDAEARRTVDIIDITNKDVAVTSANEGQLTIAYKDFRRYCHHVDSKRAVAKPEQEKMVRELRKDVREFLDVITGVDLDLPETLAIAKVSPTDAISEAGLARIFAELRVAETVARPVYEWVTAVQLFRNEPTLTYQHLFATVCVRACAYLRRHLDDLFTILLFSNVKRVENLFQETDYRVRCDVFKEAVLAFAEEANVSAAHLDWEDIFVAGSYNGWFPLPDLCLSYKEFQTRYGVLIGELARRMETLGISSHELFAAAKKSTTPAYLGRGASQRLS